MSMYKQAMIPFDVIQDLAALAPWEKMSRYAGRAVSAVGNAARRGAGWMSDRIGRLSGRRAPNSDVGMYVPKQDVRR